MRTSQLVGRVLRVPLTERLIGWAERRASWPPNQLAVLTYHRVDEVHDEHGRCPGLVSATPAEFEHQVEVLVRNFDPVGAAELLDAVRGESELPPRAVLVTFDDAVDDFERHAWPVLRRHGVPAVVFVPTAFVGDPDASFWWDALYAALTRTAHQAVDAPVVGRVDLGSSSARERAYRKVRDHLKQIPFDEVAGIVAQLSRQLEVVAPRANVLSWDQLRELAGQGVAVCGHTRTHPHLDRVSIDAARSEIELAQADLRREVGDVAPLFAYPSGQLTPEVVDVVRSAGIEAAFTTSRGTNRIGSRDPLLLRRLNMSRRSGVNGIRVQMNPWTARALAAAGGERR